MSKQNPILKHYACKLLGELNAHTAATWSMKINLTRSQDSLPIWPRSDRGECSATLYAMDDRIIVVFEVNEVNNEGAYETIEHRWLTSGCLAHKEAVNPLPMRWDDINQWLLEMLFCTACRRTIMS